MDAIKREVAALKAAQQAAKQKRKAEKKAKKEAKSARKEERKAEKRHAQLKVGAVQSSHLVMSQSTDCPITKLWLCTICHKPDAWRNDLQAPDTMGALKTMRLLALRSRPMLMEVAVMMMWTTGSQTARTPLNLATGEPPNQLCSS
jgi:hypothetical protein